MTRGTTPERGYIICSEHRSGSTLLCEWLASSGILGHPAEYLARTEDSIALDRDPGLLGVLLARAMTANGVYGLKLFSQQFDVTMRARWLTRLPNVRFIFLERRDLLGQAISLVRALQTQQYRAHEEALAAPCYDEAAIARQLRRLAEANGRWRMYFARNGADVLWLTYEDMIADPVATIRAVAAHIDVADLPTINPQLVRVSVQRDAVSDAWRALFLAKTGDLNYLDHPLGRQRVRIRRLARDVGYLLHRLHRGRIFDRGATDRPFEN